MSKYYIEKIYRGFTDSGLPPADVIVTIQYHKDNDPSQWLSNADCGGFCTIYQNNFNPFELLVSGDVDNPKFGIGMTNSFEGIEFNDYEGMFESFLKNNGNPAIPLLRLLIAITFGGEYEINSLISKAEGSYVDDINIPITEIEQDYLDELDSDD